MTMQVGLIGSNGIVLASDMKWGVPPPWDAELVRRGFLASKILISDSGKLAVGFAQSMYPAYRAAKRLIAELDDSDERTRDSRIYDIGRDEAGKENVEFILAFLEPAPTLRLFQWFNGGKDILNSPVRESLHTGDHHNPAIAWLRYYKKKPIKKLKLLAAHVVTIAGEISPDGIKGLELIYSNATGFHRVSDDENDNLQIQSRALDRQVGDAILNGNPL